MARTYEEMFEYEIGRLRGNRGDQNMFFGKAVAIQNSNKTFKLDYADKKFEFACDILIHCNYCNNRMCSQCKLEAAHAKARKDILEGRRTPKVFKKRTRVTLNLKDEKDYICKKHTDKKGNVTFTLIERSIYGGKDQGTGE